MNLKSATRFCVLLTLVFACTNLRAANYYVNDGSSTGDLWCTAIGDAGSTGTAADPFDDLGDIWSSYDLGADDTVFIDAGTYTVDATTRIEPGTNDIGTGVGDEVVIKGAGADKTFIQNSGAVYLAYFQSDVIDYIIVEDINFYNTTSIPIFSYQADYITIQRCSVRTSASNAAIVLFNSAEDNIIQDCYIIDEGSAVYGIEFQQNPAERAIIRRNHIQGQNSDPGLRAIYIEQQNHSDVQILNNYIANWQDGIYVNQSLCDGLIIHNNSIYARDRCLYGYYESDADVRNNIFYTYGGAADDYCVRFNTTGETPTFDYNLYYHPSSAKCGYRGADYDALTDWDNLFSSNDLNSVEGDPDFVDPTNNDLDIDENGSNQTGSNVGIIDLVSDDIYGTSRFNTTNDDIGAHEVPYSYYYVNDGTMDGNESWCTAIGNDGTGTGTTAAPYLTIAGALSNEALAAGDVIRVDIGTYNDGTVDLNGEASGSASAYITIEGASNIQTVLQSTSGYTFDSDIYDYWRLTNLNINNSSNNTIHMTSSSTNWKIDNCRINNTTGSQTYAAINDDGGGSHTFEDNLINAADANAIVMKGDGNTAHGNEIRSSDIGISIQTSSTNTIVNNFIISDEKGIDAQSGTGTMVYHNSFYSGQDCIDGSLGSYNIRNNILYTTSNTSTHYCIDASTDPSTCDYNLYYHPNAAQAGDFSGGVEAALTDIVAGTAFEDNGVEGDPAYSSPSDGDLELTGGTVAEGVGVSIPSVSTDIVETSRSDPPEIGGYEIPGGFFYVNDGTYDGNDVYTTAVGTNGATGTRSDPYLTLQEVFDDHNLGAGDTIFIDAGTFNDGLITVGSDDEGVSVRGVDTTKTILDNSVTTDHVLYTNDVDNLYFQDIAFYKGTTNSEAYTVDVSAGSDECTFHKCSFTALSANFQAIFCGGDHNTFSYCTIWANDDGIITDWATTPSNNVFKFNYFDLDHNTSHACLSLRGPGDTIYSNTISGGLYGIFMLDECDNGLIYNNYILNNDIGIHTETAGMDNYKVYFNSFYTDVDCIQNNFTGWDIRNNIFYTTSNSGSEYCVDASGANPTTLDYNMYYHPNTARAANINGTGSLDTQINIVVSTAFEDNGQEDDPEYTDVASEDLSIPSSVDAYQAAVVISGFDTDIRTWVRDGTSPTIGAFEPDAAFPLPVEMFSLNTQCEGDHVAISWATASEFNNEVFLVERSSDGTHFEVIDEVDGAGNSNSMKHYSMLDDAPLNGAYYRVRQVDFDGHQSVSHEVFAAECADGVASKALQARVLKTAIVVPYSIAISQNTVVRMVNANGKEVFNKTYSLSPGVHQLSIPKHPYAKGMYLITVSDSMGERTSKLMF